MAKGRQVPPLTRASTPAMAWPLPRTSAWIHHWLPRTPEKEAVKAPVVPLLGLVVVGTPDVLVPLSDVVGGAVVDGRVVGRGVVGSPLLEEDDENRHWTRTFVANIDDPKAKPVVLWDHSSDELYKHPGWPVMRPLRKRIPLAGGVDLSPLVFFIIAELILIVILAPLEQQFLSFF